MIVADLRRLHGLLTRPERQRMWAIAGLIALTALLQLASLTAIYLFLAGIANSNQSWPDPLARLATALGVTGFRLQAMVMAGGAFALLVAANASMAGVERAKLRLEADVNAGLSTRMLASYLQRPHAFFTANHSALIARTVLTSVREVCANFLRSVMDLASKVTLAVAVIVLLILLEPTVSIVMAALLAVGFFVVYATTRRWVRAQGMIVDEAQRARNRIVHEVLGGVKEVKLLGRESAFVAQFAKPSSQLAKAQGKYEFSFHLQKYALETVAFGAILILVATLLVLGRDIADIVPIVGLLAIAGYRLMPAFRDISTAISSLGFYGAFLNDVARDYLPPIDLPTPTRLPLASAIRVDAVHFAYDQVPVLDGVTFDIPAGLVVAFVGASGAGKSTLADLVMGIRPPTSGRISIDDTTLTPDNARSWQRSIGYVPQEIFLADATIEQNIAFGVPTADIDPAAVRRAAALAQISSYIETNLPEGYATVVGERGVKLSGGQRQRIGIARALYHDPAVLILDEATSDVDGATEAQIAQAVRSLGGQKTVLLIAHRLTAIRHCDRVIYLEKGRVAAIGTFEELVAGNPGFRATVQALPHNEALS